MTPQKDPKKVKHSLSMYYNTLLYTNSVIFIWKTIVEWLSVLCDYQNILITSSRGGKYSYKDLLYPLHNTQQ